MSFPWTQLLARDIFSFFLQQAFWDWIKLCFWSDLQYSSESYNVIIHYIFKQEVINRHQAKNSTLLIFLFYSSVFWKCFLKYLWDTRNVILWGKKDNEKLVQMAEPWWQMRKNTSSYRKHHLWVNRRLNHCSAYQYDATMILMTLYHSSVIQSMK